MHYLLLSHQVKMVQCLDLRHNYLNQCRDISFDLIGVGHAQQFLFSLKPHIKEIVGQNRRDLAWVVQMRTFCHKS